MGMPYFLLAPALAALIFTLPASAQDFGETVSATVDAFREMREQNAAPDNVKAIFARAKEAEKDGCINLCGFYLGMSETDAQKLATYYGLKGNQWSFYATPETKKVYKMTFTLHGIRRVTKGGNSFDELAQAVANRIGTMNPKRNDDYDLVGYEYKNIDNQTAIMSERYGLVLDDSELARKVQAERFEMEHKAAERAQEQAEEERIRKERMAEKLATAEKMGIPEKAKEAIARVASDMIHIPGKKYLMSKYEVTQALWFAVMEEVPSQFIGANLPVENVSWNDCKTFLEKLNSLPEIQTSGYTFRLPSTEEWEYACRAGATGGYCQLVEGTEISKETLSEIAWFDYNSNGITHSVGQKKPNAFGLYDMIGNIVEWTDTQDDGGYICCGSSWISPASYSESSARIVHNPSFLYDTLGFRLACDVK